MCHLDLPDGRKIRIGLKKKMKEEKRNGTKTTRQKEEKNVNHD